MKVHVLIAVGVINAALAVKIAKVGILHSLTGTLAISEKTVVQVLIYFES